MKAVVHKCPNCKANLDVKEGDTNGVCEYCRAPYSIDDGVIRVEHTVEIKNDDNYPSQSRSKRGKKSNYQTYRFNNNSFEFYNDLDTLNIDLTSLDNLYLNLDSLESHDSNFFYFQTK